MTDDGRADKTSTPDLSGTTVAGRFDVHERLAAGAHGVVYRATQQPLGRSVALKVLRADAADPHAEERLLREGQAIAALRHENVVAVYDAGRTAEGAPFVVMELVRGPSLRALFERGPLPWRDVVAIGRGIGRALAAAHAAGVVHRDLKPENVLLATDGDAPAVGTPAAGPVDARAVRVVDFGLAKRTAGVADASPSASLSASAVIRGTPAYMSPEQANGGPGDAHSDLYALGVVLYEALTGANPFRAETPLKTLVRHTEGPRPPAPSSFCDAPPALDALVSMLLQIDPRARPPDAGAVLVALDALDALHAVSSGARTPITAREPTVRRAALGLAGSAVAIALVTIGAIAWLVRGPAQQEPLADAAHDAGVSAHGAHDAGAAAADAPPDAGALADRTFASADAGFVVGTRAPTERPRAPRAPDAGPAPAPDARAPALVRQLEFLRAECATLVPCATELPARYQHAIESDLQALKQLRADADACLAACVNARIQ